MKIKFIGDHNPEVQDDTQLIVAFGIDFPLDEWIEVEDKAICEKLSGNPHFVSKVECTAKSKESVAEKATNEPEKATPQLVSKKKASKKVD